MDLRRADVIAGELEELILTAAFEAGARLDEARLARMFGVSRTPIREALHKLGATGLVEHRPRRGVFVRGIGPAELLDLFEYMAELEASCGRLAATRLTEAGLAEIAAAHAGCESADGAEAYYAANQRFHHLIYRHSGNEVLADAAEQMHRRLQTFRRLQLRVRGRMQQSLGEHRAVLRALRAGDAMAAAEGLRAHVAVQGEKFHGLLAQMRVPPRR